MKGSTLEVDRFLLPSLQLLNSLSTSRATLQALYTSHNTLQLFTVNHNGASLFSLFLQFPFHLFSSSPGQHVSRHPARPPLLLYLLSPPTVRLPGFTRARCTFLRLFHLFPIFPSTLHLNSPHIDLSLIHPQYSSNYAALLMTSKTTQLCRKSPEPFDPFSFLVSTSPLTRPPFTSLNRNPRSPLLSSDFPHTLCTSRPRFLTPFRPIFTSPTFYDSFPNNADIYFTLLHLQGGGNGAKSQAAKAKALKNAPKVANSQLASVRLAPPSPLAASSLADSRC